MRIAYLVNLYPAPSHTFIRREIVGLERLGHEVVRISHRPARGDLPEAADREEQQRTTNLLGRGPALLEGSVLAPELAKAARRQAGRLAASMRDMVAWGCSSPRGIARHVGYLGLAARLAGRLQSMNIDHVHAHFGTNAAMVALLCRRLGGPRFSFTAHGPQEFETPEALRLREKVREAHFVVTVSEFASQQLCHHCDERDHGKVHVVRCGVDERFLGQRPAPPPDDSGFLCIGRLCEEKNHRTLLEAMALVRQRGVKARLTLIGDGPLRGDLERQARDLDLGGDVEFRGTCDNDQVIAALQGCRAMVLASVAEGLPVAIMEAFAMGRPVIATPVGGITELVEHGENGWLVTTGCAETMASALSDAARRDPAELLALGFHGRARVKDNHDASRNAHRLSDLFGLGTSGKPGQTLERRATAP